MIQSANEIAPDKDGLQKPKGSRPRKKRPTVMVTGPSKSQLLIHYGLCLLVLTIIFEGLARKLAPPVLGIPIFFAKDLITVSLLGLCLASKKHQEVERILNWMALLALLLLPCLFATAIHDPILALFGLKQYVLFSTVAVAMCAAYLPNNRAQFFSLFRLLAGSILITTSVAVMQNRLPMDHWLNLSVGGEDTSAFAAGGYLRVSSTFSFVGQYCCYLNALCFVLPVFLYFRKSARNWFLLPQTAILIGLAIIGTFVTGSRGAVIGNAGILCVAAILIIICGRGVALLKIILPLIIGLVSLQLLQLQYPELFAAYQARVEGASEATHATEMEKRIKDSLLDWTDGSAQAPPSLFGYGLGVMSNGSDKLSPYAAQWRNSGFWTETDQATTLFEGGWYLIVVWYGFRVLVIYQSLVYIFKMRNNDFRLIACFAGALIFILGVTGVLAIQPPMAIWWWLAVGLIVCLGQFDRQEMAKLKPISNPVPDRDAGHTSSVTT